jgi:hypothetical protein
MSVGYTRKTKTVSIRRRRKLEGRERERARERQEASDSQTQLFGRLRLVMRRTLLADLAMGIAQHTTRGVVRPLVLLLLLIAG